MTRPGRFTRASPRPSAGGLDFDGTDSGLDATTVQGAIDEVRTDDRWKQPVRVATTGTITIATALNSGDTIDGVTLADGDRVLVKDQSTGSQNGIYVVSASPARATDFDEDDEVLGSVVHVVAGTANAGKRYYLANTSAPTIGSTTLTFTEITGGGGSTIDVEDEGSNEGAIDTLNFTGAGVSVTVVGSEAEVIIPGGGGGGSLVYLGYNTVGGTEFSINYALWYAKQITTSGAGLLAGIELYFREAADSVQSVITALMEDNAGVPGKFLSSGRSIILAPTNNPSFGGGTASVARWMNVAMNYNLAGSTSYWVAWKWTPELGGSPDTRMFFDGSGSDRTWTPGNHFITDGGRYSETNTGNKYSVRALVLEV